MDSTISILKGIHPGLFLERELKKRHLAKGKFSISLNEYPKTIVSIIKGQRSMNVNLALKIENALNLEEGFLMILQVFHDIKKEKRKSAQHPNLSIFRPAMFWDTKIEMIDWNQQKRAVIERVFERGNDSKKKEIVHFNGEKTIDKVLHTNSLSIRPLQNIARKP
jgi:plasmid maintenance system antidote protein VapI